MIELIQEKQLILLKVISAKDTWFLIIGFLIMGSNFKILSVMAAMIWPDLLCLSITGCEPEIFSFGR